jgi:hypothetical protein
VGTALALLVAAGFLWSIVLFFAAVFMRERDQDAGFGWALVGALAYVVTFSDWLPGQPSGIRHLLEVMPGVSRADAGFASPVAVIAALAITYVVRILIFYQLFFDFADLDIDGDGEVDDVNDLVAPFLSYLCFAVCVITALAGLYDLSAIAVFFAAIAALSLYYVPHLLRYVRPYLEVAYEAVRTVVVILIEQTKDAGVFAISKIALAGLARRGSDSTKVIAWKTEAR